jgi:hypothetical protein
MPFGHRLRNQITQQLLLHLQAALSLVMRQEVKALLAKVGIFQMAVPLFFVFR